MSAYPHRLAGIEIAKVGKHDGREITQADLEQAVASFMPVPVRSGDHAGWDCGKVVALRVSGDTLLADLRVDDETADAIRYDLLDSCSIHLVHDRQGARVDHVALLDCRRKPAVAGLRRLHHFLAGDDHREHGVHRYDASQLRSIRGIEIFRTGKWNGDVYDIVDLQSMIDAFPRVGFRPPVTLGHDTASGDRAFGWVTGLRLVGETLVADFGDIPEPLFDLIKERGYDAVSAEIYWDVERDGVTYKRALKSVALLGAQTPAVADLAPLRSVVNTYPDVAVHVHELQTKEAEMAEQDPGAALVEMARQYMHQNPGARMSMMAALEAVRLTPGGAALCHRWATGGRAFVTPGHAAPVAPVQRNHTQRPDVSAEVDKAARAYIGQNPKTTYSNAVAAVLEADKALLHRYAGGRS